MSRKRNSIIAGGEQKKKKKSRVISKFSEQNPKEIDADSPPNPDIPEELIVDNILTKFSVGDLLSQNIYTVGKLWHNLIFRDQKFAAHHFARQKNHELNLVFSLLNVYNADDNEQLSNHFFNLQKDRRRRRDCDTHNLKLSMRVFPKYMTELVGYCNGLACFKYVSEPAITKGILVVINQARKEKLCLTYDTPRKGVNGRLAKHLCHGFGFDSSSQEYKVVVIYTAMTIAGDLRFICMVITLGTKSWKKIVTSISEMSPPPGCGAFPIRMVTRAWKSSRTSGTLSGDLLLWNITNTSKDGGNGIEMLLSFGIHDEKIQFIRLPTECTSLTQTTNEHQYLEIDHQLLDFKGYPCVARAEKIRNTDHQHRSRRGCERQSGFCCFQFKVHLYLLKDKVKQMWTKEEDFDVQMKDEGVVHHPFCCYFDPDTTATTPPTRMLSSSGQVLLYWYNGQYLIFYNLQTKHLKVVKCSRSEQHQELFWAKMYGVNPYVIGQEDGNINCPYNDYQLHAHVDNILSLKTFIPVPEGEVARLDCLDDVSQFIREKQPAGWVATGSNDVHHYLFL